MRDKNLLRWILLWALIPIVFLVVLSRFFFGFEPLNDEVVDVIENLISAILGALLALASSSRDDEDIKDKSEKQ